LAAAGHAPAIAFESRFVRNGRGAPSEVVPLLKAQSGVTGKGDAAPLVFKTSHFTRGKDGAPNSITPPLSADADKGDQDLLVVPPLVARSTRGSAQTLSPGFNTDGHIVAHAAPRRLTPRECERLQGLPDDWTSID
jgi:DNA (cytosine-5)-methyltransferase 1